MLGPLPYDVCVEYPTTGSPVSRRSATAPPPRALEIRAEQIRTLYRFAPPALASGLVVPAILAAALWDAVPRASVLGWLASMAAVAAIRTGLVVAFRRVGPGKSDMSRWVAAYLAGALASGAVWGAAGVLFYVPADLDAQFLLAFILAGMCTGAVTSLGAHLPTFFAFALPTMLPYVAVALFEGDRVHAAVSLAILFYLAALAFFARNLNRTLAESLALRFENLDLVAALTAQKDEAERANAAKTRFLAAASHDLRQPLHALTLFVSALEDKLTEHPARPLVERVAGSVEALDDLFNALLDISKLDAGIVRPDVRAFALQPVFDRLIGEFAGTAEAARLRLGVVPTRLVVVSDATLLERILRNLLSNALRYTRRGGVVLGCRRRGATVRIEVHDTGRGIPADRLREVFQEFVQLENPERDRAKGLGLGLAIVDRLAGLLGHEIDVASVPGRGSSFAVALPRADEPDASEPDAAPVEASGEVLEGAVIVVVDDERSVLDAVGEVLRGWGCRVLLAASAEEAVRLVAQAGVVPSVVLADYRLRDEQTGVGAIERIQAACGAPVPGVLITGDTAPDRLREAESSGYHLLHKPVRPARLRALLAHLLSR